MYRKSSTPNNTYHFRNAKMKEPKERVEPTHRKHEKWVYGMSHRRRRDQPAIQRNDLSSSSRWTRRSRDRGSMLTGDRILVASADYYESPACVSAAKKETRGTVGGQLFRPLSTIRRAYTARNTS